MKRRVTIIDIAKKTGFSFATVSRVLSHAKHVSAKTRAIVQAAVDELGYEPDPMMSALANYRRHQRRKTVTAAIAYLVNSPLQKLTPQDSAFAIMYKGAQKAAGELGYKLEEMWVEADGMSNKRLSDILIARGIRGLIVSPSTHGSNWKLNLRWSHFAAVAIGYTLASPRLHTVTGDYAFAMQECFRQLMLKGHQKIAFLVSDRVLERNEHRWLSAFLTLAHLHRDEVQCLDCIVPYSQPEAVKQWWNALSEKPDAYIFVDSGHARWYLEYLKLKKSPSIALLSRRPEDPYDGIQTDFFALGGSAASLLISLIHRNEFGLNEMRQTLSMQSPWVNQSSA